MCCALAMRPCHFLGEADVPAGERVGAGADTSLDLDEHGNPVGSLQEQGQGQPQSQSATSRASDVDEAAVSTLTEMGFSREQATQALEACGGNAEMAAGMLLN